MKSSAQPAATTTGKAAAKKCKGKTVDSLNPLDQTCIHPESYSVAQRWETHKHANMHTYTCTTAYPAGQSMFRLRWSWFDTITYGVGYTGEGLWFDLRRHGIQEKRLWLCTHVVCVSLCEKWLLELLMLISKAHWTSVPALWRGVHVYVCAPSCSCSHSALFSLHRFWH